MLRKFFGLFTFSTLLLFSAGCEEKTLPPASSSAEVEDTEAVQPAAGNGTLVLYFSNTGNTKKVAEFIAEEMNADIYRIFPEVPYTSADLNYSDSSTRATREQNDPSARPALSGPVEGLEDYSTIFLGFPIWWGQAPKLMYTLVESHDFSGKTIIPFCTSGSSPIGSSATNLHSTAGDAGNWLEGRRFSRTTTKSEVADWIQGLPSIQP